MPKNILLANLGNRNLYFKTDDEANRKRQRENYRQWSHDLLERYEEVAPHLEPVIIPAVLDQPETYPVEELILFYSDTPAEEGRNNQDTLYVAQILKKLLPERYPGIQVFLKPLKCNPANAEGLLKRFRSKIRTIVNKQPETAYYYVLDAGGTPQMKSAMKIMMEYQLPENRYTLLEGLKGRNNETLIGEMQPNEYRKVLQAEAAFRLVEKGEYAGAMEVLGFDPFAEQQPNRLGVMLQTALLRKQMDHGAIQKRANQVLGALKKREKVPEWLENLSIRAEEDLSQKWDGLLTPQEAFRFKEFWRWSTFYYSLGDYSSTVLTLHNGFEYGLNRVLEKAYEGNLKGNRENTLEKIGEALIDKPEVKEWMRKKESDKLEYSLPTLILAALHNGAIPASFVEWVELFTPYIKGYQAEIAEAKHIQYLDVLRNHLAHEGKGVTRKDIQNLVEPLDHLLRHVLSLCLATEHSIQEMNEDLAHWIQDDYQ